MFGGLGWSTSRSAAPSGISSDNNDIGSHINNNNSHSRDSSLDEASTSDLTSTSTTLQVTAPSSRTYYLWAVANENVVSGVPYTVSHQ